MADKVDIWMPVYVADYLTDTMHLTCEESGAYLHLLFHSWKVGPLPKDTEQLRRIARVEKKPWAAVWASLSAFWTLGTDGYTQSRCEKERAEWLERRAANVAKAKAAVEAREARRQSGAAASPRSSPRSSPGSSTGASSDSTPSSSAGSTSGSHQDNLESIPSPSPSPKAKEASPTPSPAKGLVESPGVPAKAKHVASERTVGVKRGPLEPAPRSPEEHAALEAEVDALFARPAEMRERRVSGDLARLAVPPSLAALRAAQAKPLERLPTMAQARAMLEELHGLFAAQFGKPPQEGWEDALDAWNRCFEHAAVGSVEMDGDQPVVYLVTSRPKDLADGLQKFHGKVRQAMRMAFGREVQLVLRDEAVAA